MFTGLVTDIGTIVSMKKGRGGTTFTIATSYPSDDLQLGESIACNGACLTVTRIQPGRFDADASPETLAKTTFPYLKAGDSLHLERALRVGDRLGGHYVTGHIDCVGRVHSIQNEKNSNVFTFFAPKMLAPLLVEKGSIAINGVSLTVNDVDDVSDGVLFRVTIIPFTFSDTCFSSYQVGTQVNLEGDIIGKYIQRFQGVSATPSSSITLEKLRHYGFSD